MNFHAFKTVVAKQFDRLQQNKLYCVALDKDEVWDEYLNAWPEGTNPVMRTRREYDCGCCKQFVRTVGNVVAVIDGKLQSVWDVSIPNEPHFQAVADTLAALVKSRSIEDIFLHFERKVGTDKTFEQMVDHVLTWEHFFVNLKSEFVLDKDRIPSKLAGPRTTQEVALRGLTEITDDAVDTVLDLIAQNSIYRGEEFKFQVESFQKLKRQFNTLATDQARSIFVWTQIGTVPESVANIRNTVIGTLLTDLSADDVSLEAAVGKYEFKVAPQNFHRSTALVTKAMIEKAKATIDELGLTSALDRRYAVLEDISINNVLFADRPVKRVMRGNVFDDLLAETSAKVKTLDTIEEVPIDRFLSEVLPRIESIEVLFEGKHTGNLMSLVAPIDPTAGRLFKWDNNFSWSYNGEMADSIKERVKKAGGNVVGDLCCRLSWSNYDDLDLHMFEPGGSHIYYGTKTMRSVNGGQLDVDMNAGAGHTREPVENIFYASRNFMQDGVYTLGVHNFCKREAVNVGFEVEMDYLGEVRRFVFDKAVPHHAMTGVVKFEYTRVGGIKILESLPSTEVTKTVWGIPTQTFHRVNVMMLSPGHWDDRAVGNKHYFFMLNGCVNDTTARGFFNEQLKEDLQPHRKVFEMVGSKMKVADSTEQLSGLGFSSTQKNTLVCRVKGSFNRTIKLVF